MTNATRKLHVRYNLSTYVCSVDRDDGRSKHGKFTDAGKCDDRSGAGYLHQGRRSDPAGEVSDLSPRWRHRTDVADDLRGDLPGAASSSAWWRGRCRLGSSTTRSESSISRTTSR